MSKVKELRSLSEIVWRCRKCGNQQESNMSCSKCGTFEFDRVDKRFAADAPSRDYTVRGNISYDGQLVRMGETINLADDDPAVKSLLKRKLIEEIVAKKGK